MILAKLILDRLDHYQCSTAEDYKNALLEIIQEVTLLALWRSKFFEKAAFYGGTALRILYGLDRFSEDLDFSLLTEMKDFRLEPFHHSIAKELHSLGFEVSVEEKKKEKSTAIKSAFIKANTRIHLIKVGLSDGDKLKVPSNQTLKVKFEIDTQPPLHFETEHVPLGFPAPFSVRAFTLPDLFAGKMHAILFRDYASWVKGRDWYDYLWFLSKNVPINLRHLEERMRQTGAWPDKERLTKEHVCQLLKAKIEMLDIQAAKDDVKRFINDPWKIDNWSKDYFLNTIDLISASQ